MVQPFLFTVSPSCSGPAAPLRLDQFLVAQQRQHPGLSQLSRQAAQRLIAGGHVTVNGAPGRASQRLLAGFQVSLVVPPPAKSALLPQAHPFEVLFEDDDLLVLNKPPHLPVHPGAGVRTATLVAALLALGTRWSGIGGVERPGIVHRLDAGTTGAMVVAKNDVAHRGLAAQFAARTVQKTYLALCAAVLPASWPRRGSIDTPFGRHPKHRQRFTGRLLAATRRAKTLYRVLGQGRHDSLVELTLLTGRTHQARVHLAELGLPVVGDALYAPRGRSQALAAALGLTHQALHAAALSFLHPRLGTPCHFAALPPSSWWPHASALEPADGGL